MYAHMILTDRPSVNSVMGVVAFTNEGEVIRCIVNNQVLNDFGMLGLKRGVKTYQGDVRLSKEKFKHRNLLVTIEKMAVEMKCDMRIPVNDFKD